MSRGLLLVTIGFLSGSVALAQSDSLNVDTLPETKEIVLPINILLSDAAVETLTGLFSWEEEWLQWCEQSSCVSSGVEYSSHWISGLA